MRALVGSGWGFFAVPDLSDAVGRGAPAQQASRDRRGQRHGRRAAARAASPASRSPASWASECAIDPLGVVAVRQGRPARRGRRRRWASTAPTSPRALYQIWDTAKWFVSSEGHRIDQRIRECGAGIMATAIGDGETQRRSYPAARGQYGTRGWELVDEIDLDAHAARVADEARALLSAPPCPSGETTLILGAEQMALQIHESVGHAIELDRILGWEAAYAGTSLARPRPARRAAVRLGADEHHDRPDDPRRPRRRSASTTRARRPRRATPCATGRWVGVLAGRDSAAVAGLDYAGSVRADGWARLPMVRMTNVGLEPGPHTLDEIIAATDDGIFMETNRSWSIDDKRLNFQFGCEVGYEVKNGQLGRLLRNPTYTGIGPQFWRSMDMLSSEIVAWGTPNCGKGQPGQIGHTGHPAAPGPLPQRPGRGAGMSERARSSPSAVARARADGAEPGGRGRGRGRPRTGWR